MAEASAGRANFEDVREDTFVRFCQFAYTGEYTTPDFIHKPGAGLLSPLSLAEFPTPASDDGETPAPPPAPEPEPVGDHFWGSKLPKKKKSPVYSNAPPLPKPAPA
jgi:hypothetical protein